MVLPVVPACKLIFWLGVFICSHTELHGDDDKATVTPSAEPTGKTYVQGTAYGDPHLLMWNGNRFSYHGECDIVLFYSPSFGDGAGLHVHIRTTIRKYYSFIESAAFQIDDNVLEFHGKEKLYMNGEEVNKAPAFLGEYPIEHLDSSIICENRNCADAEINKIDFGKDGFAVVIMWKGHLNVNMYASDDGFSDGVGVLGLRKTPGMFDRHGTPMFNTTLYTEDWQVRDWEPQLFKEARYPKYPNRCISPPEMPARKMEDGFLRLAEEACAKASDGEKNVCIFDVLATRDIEMAIPYTF